MKKTAMLGAFAALTLFASPALAATFVSPDVANSGNDGVIFDVRAGDGAVTFESLSLVLWGKSERNVAFEIYTYDGGLAGHEGSLSGWTLRDTLTVRIPKDSGERIFDITDFTVAAGSTTGFYIRTLNRDYASVMFHDVPGYVVGADRGSDGAITLVSGYGVGKYGLNVGRSFAGSITYTAAPTAVPEPASWALMITGFGLAGATLRRRGREGLSAT